MIIEKKKLSELNAAPYNPRQSTAKQEKQLKASLEKFGLVEPVIYNKRTGYIVGGHFRVRELQKLGCKEIDCVIVDLSDEDERELNIRLNANTGGWDWDMLANEWNDKDLKDWGLNIPVVIDELKLDQTEIDNNKPASLKITFKTIEQLQEAENDIQELIDRKYQGATYKLHIPK